MRRPSREARDDGGPPPDPVDGCADHDHERVHADDVGADHREDVGLMVAVVERRRSPSGSSPRPCPPKLAIAPTRPVRDARPAEDLAQRRRRRRSGRPRRCSWRAIICGSGRIGEHEPEPDHHDPGGREPRHDERVERQLLAGEERPEDEWADRGAEERPEEDVARSRAPAARADTCLPRRRARAGSSPGRRRRARSRRSRALPTRPRSRARSSGSRRSRRRSPRRAPARGRTGPSAARPGTRQSRRRAGRSPARARGCPRSPVTSTSVTVATATTSCTIPESDVSVAASRIVFRRTGIVHRRDLQPVASDPERHSHSIVAGGFDEMSSATRLIPGSSLMIRLEIVSSRS